MDLTSLDTAKEVRVGSCSSTLSGSIPFTGRIDEISLWNGDPSVDS